MTPSDIKKLRKELGLTQSGLAELIGLKSNGEKTIRDWENERRPITGPAALVMRYIKKYGLL